MHSGWQRGTMLAWALGAAAASAAAQAVPHPAASLAPRTVLVALLLEAPAFDAPAPSLGQHGTVRGGAQPYLGVDVRDVAEEEVAALRLRDTRGAEIVRVDHDAPAGTMGLRVRDVVVQMNGVAIEAAEPLRRMLHEMQPGHAVALVVARDGQTLTLTATMADRAEVEREAWQHHLAVPAPAPVEEAETAPTADAAPATASRYSKSFLGTLLPAPSYTGAMLEKLSPQLAAFFGSQEGRGMLVRSVETNSPAEMAGLHAGDIVLRMNGHDLHSQNDWTHGIHDAKGHPLSLVILRDRQERTLTLVPDSKRRSSLDVAPASSPQSRLELARQSCPTEL